MQGVEAVEPSQETETDNDFSYLYYNEVVIDHFMNPRNVGELADSEASGFATVGDPSCGDQMKLWIVVENDIVTKIRFKSFGCPGAIATSSMLTCLVEGKAVQNAMHITDDDVVDALQGISAKKRHCSLLGVRALQAALLNWQQKNHGATTVAIQS